MNNPYPETITDEATGIQVSNPLHKAWEEGFEAALSGPEFEEAACEYCRKVGWQEPR